MDSNTRIASSASASTAAAFCTIMGFAASAVDVRHDWWVDEARMHRWCLRVRSTNLDGKDEDGMDTDKEDIYVDALAARMTVVFNGDRSGIMFPEYVLDPHSCHPILV
jgi:hypothetical protein